MTGICSASLAKKLSAQDQKVAQDNLLEIVFRKGEPKAAKYEEMARKYLEACTNSGVRGCFRNLRELVLLRGPPGIGKSTMICNELRHKGVLLAVSNAVGARKGDNMRDVNRVATLVHACSTDDFFTKLDDGSEEYHIDTKKFGLYHNQNMERARLLMSLNVTPLYIDNTNMKLCEMQTYIKDARASGYQIRFVEPFELDPRWNEIDFLRERNQLREASGKNFPVEVLQKIIQNYEPFEPGRSQEEKIQCVYNAHNPFAEKANHGNQ